MRSPELVNAQLRQLVQSLSSVPTAQEASELQELLNEHRVVGDCREKSGQLVIDRRGGLTWEFSNPVNRQFGS